MQPNFGKACGHAAGINMATIPGGHDQSSLRMSNDEAVRQVLARIADDIEHEMRRVAKSWKQCSDGATKARDKALYDGLNFAIGVLQRQWERLGRRDNILAVMPPTDGFDENNNPRDGIADYCAMLDQDIPY